MSILTELRGTEYKHKGMRNAKSEKDIALISKSLLEKLAGNFSTVEFNQNIKTEMM